MSVEKAIHKFSKAIDNIRYKIKSHFRLNKPSTVGTFDVFSSEIKALSVELSDRVKELELFYLDKDLNETEEYRSFIEDYIVFKSKTSGQLDEIASFFTPVNVPTQPPRDDYVPPLSS